ncbi:MAG: NYN domain-containing protein [Nitrospirae bacterium]|nr:NYN domain-containing protein [Nitrospirota bacterium]
MTIKIKHNNYAFIDSQNLNLGVQKQGWKLDFAKFRILLRDKYDVQRAFIFIGFVPGNQVLYSYLQNNGYNCIFKPTVLKTNNGKTEVKGNCDADLVLHTMIEYSNFEKAVIVAGDGDYYCLYEYLSKQNKLFKIIVPNKKFSSLIRKFNMFIVNIQLFKDKLIK